MVRDAIESKREIKQQLIHLRRVWLTIRNDPANEEELRRMAALGKALYDQQEKMIVHGRKVKTTCKSYGILYADAGAQIEQYRGDIRHLSRILDGQLAYVRKNTKILEVVARTREGLDEFKHAFKDFNLPDLKELFNVVDNALISIVPGSDELPEGKRIFKETPFGGIMRKFWQPVLFVLLAGCAIRGNFSPIFDRGKTEYEKTIEVIRSKEYLKADSICREHLESHRKDYRMHSLFGAVLIFQGKYVEAVYEFNIAIPHLKEEKLLAAFPSAAAEAHSTDEHIISLWIRNCKNPDSRQKILSRETYCQSACYSSFAKYNTLFFCGKHTCRKKQERIF